jgi:PST family polysaccharide transporter
MSIWRLLIPRTTSGSNNPERFFQIDHLKHDLKGRAARGGAVIAGAQIIRQTVSIGSSIILARLLGPENSGLIAMAAVLIGFIESFSDLGLSAATVQRAEINQKQVSTLFWINMAVSLVLALITASLAPAIAWFYNDPRLTLITLALGSAFLFDGLTAQHRALLDRQMRYTSLSILGIVSTIVSNGAGILAALAGFGYWSLVIMKLASEPVQIIGIWYLCPWQPGGPSRTSGVGSMLAFGTNLTGFRLVMYLARNVDNLLIGRFYGPVQLGLYAKAYGLLVLPLRRVNEPFAGVAWPALARLTDDPARYRKAYMRIVSNLCLLTIPLVAFMIGAADWLVLSLLGPEWAAASRIFAWLGISGLVEPFTTTTGWLFVSQGRTREQFHWAIISSVITVASILAGLPWGIVGVAAAYGIVGLLIRTPLLLWYVGRTGPVTTKDLYRSIAPFIFISCVILLILLAFRLSLAGVHPLINLIAAGGITAAITLVALAVLPIGRQALQDAMSLPALILKQKKTA